MKRIFLTLLFIIFFLFILFPKDSFAQGTCQCSWNDTKGNFVIRDKCEANYEAVCNTTDQDKCSCETKETSCKKSGTLDVGEVCCVGYYEYTVNDVGNPVTFCYLDGYDPMASPTPANAKAKEPFCDPAIGVSSGIDTALGCVKIGSGEDLIETILQIATGVGGGIALALILYGTFIVTTSAGMPDKLKAGSEIITSAIVGLIFILLSIFLVNLIGINILGIPGLT